MSKIGIKTFIIMIIIALGGLFIVSIFMNYSIKKNFSNYVVNEKEKQVTELVNLIEKHLSQNKSWSGVKELINNFGSLNQIELFILDNQGNIIAATRNMSTRHQMMRKGMMHNNKSRYNINKNNFKKEKIELNNKIMGTFLWKIPQAQKLLSQQGKIFTNKINKAIVISASLMSIITIIISYFFSQYITNPLIKMNKYAHRVAKGKFEQKVSIRGKDELAELGNALNTMTKKLNHLEKIRKKSTSDLAHELRTPISTLKSYIEGIEDGVLKLNSVTIKEMKEELERLIKLINKLKELNDAEQKLIQLEKYPIDIINLLKNIIQRYKNKAKKKNIDLKFIPEKNNIKIKGDEDSLKTIFTNLVSNALKYTPKNGEVILNIETKENQVYIEIEDDGIGISKEDLPYIFERFYRADKARTKNTGGTGIGLAIVKELVNALNGNIKVDSKLQEGTRFTIIFPLVEDSSF